MAPKIEKSTQVTKINCTGSYDNQSDQDRNIYPEDEENEATLGYQNGIPVSLVCFFLEKGNPCGNVAVTFDRKLPPKRKCRLVHQIKTR